MTHSWNDPRAAASQGYQQGVADTQQRYETGLQQAIASMRQEFDQRLNQMAGGLRKQSSAEARQLASRVDQQLADLGKVAAALTAQATGRSDADNVYVEDIPGSRIPFIYLVEIPIQAGDTSVREQTITISQEGPFVAERRWATFLSAYEFQVTDPETGAPAKFLGRSNGRYRPVHSASDYADSQHNSRGDTVAWVNTFSAGGATMPGGVIALPSHSSSFRTMQFDGVIEMEDGGSNWRRQNRPVPSAFWAPETNGPVPFSALDFFERNSAITLKVTPNHVSNPPSGNVSGIHVIPNTLGIDGYPFIEGQYDLHEGIATPEPATVDDDQLVPIEEDPIQRLPDGYLVLALEGYRIAQPTGPVR